MAFAPTALKWILGIWCTMTLLAGFVNMILKPSIALKIFRKYQPQMFNDSDGDMTFSEVEIHLQRLIGIQAVGRAIYAIFVLISGDDNQVISISIANVIADSMTIWLYYSSRGLVTEFQTRVHLIMITLMNAITVVFIAFSLSHYRVKND